MTDRAIQCAEAIEALVDKTTPSPWAAHYGVHGDPQVVIEGQPLGVVAVISTEPDDYGRANNEYIAAVRQLAPEAAKYIRKLSGRIEELEAVLTTEKVVDNIERRMVEHYSDVIAEHTLNKLHIVKLEARIEKIASEHCDGHCLHD